MAVRACSISAGLAASTVTPGSTAPLGSFTVPVIEAWANSSRGIKTNPARTKILVPSAFIAELLPGYFAPASANKPDMALHWRKHLVKERRLQVKSEAGTKR